MSDVQTPPRTKAYTLEEIFEELKEKAKYLESEAKKAQTEAKSLKAKAEKAQTEAESLKAESKRKDELAVMKAYNALCDVLDSLKVKLDTLRLDSVHQPYEKLPVTE